MAFCDWASSSTVVWWEYLPPSISWRYKDEEWKEIEADNFTLETKKGECPVPYNFHWRYRTAPDRDWVNRTAFSYANNTYNPPFENLLFYADDRTVGYDGGDFPIFEIAYFQANRGRYNFIFKFDYTDFRGDRKTYNLSFGSSFRTNMARMEFLGFERADNLPDDCGDCTFTITKNGKTVYQEIRDICPEVKKLSARLSDICKQFTVTKKTDVESIEINQDSIPNNCLNIYLKSVDESKFIEQICSSGDKPPEYEVICNADDSESCPPNTCPIKCGSKVCCYDSQGTPIKSIDYDRYSD